MGYKIIPQLNNYRQYFNQVMAKSSQILRVDFDKTLGRAATVYKCLHT